MQTYLKHILITIACTLFSLHCIGQTPNDPIKIDLNKAIEIALSDNPTMRIAGREVEVKKNYKREQIVSLFPDVSASGSFNRTLLKQTMVMDFNGQNMEIEVGTDNNWSAGFNLSLPVVAPALWFNLKLSQLDVELAMENARASKISLVGEVKKAYYNYLLAKDSYRVLQLNYNNVKMNFENIAKKYEQGMASEFDKLRAEVQMKNQIPNMKSAESGVELASMMLKVLIGIDMKEAISFEGSLEDFENEMLTKAAPDVNTLSLSQNSDIHKLDLSLQQLNTASKILISSAAPTLGLQGALQTSTMFNDGNYGGSWYPNSYIAFGLNIPIVSWAGTAYKLKSNKLNISNLEDQKKYVEDNLRISLYNSVTKIKNAIEELASNKETVLQAEKAHSISQKQYEVGMATWLDLNAVELALTGARLAYHQSIYNYLTAYAELEKTLGNN